MSNPTNRTTSGAGVMDDATMVAKVLSLDGDVVDLKQSVDNLGKRLLISHDQLSSKMDSQAEKIYSKIDNILQSTAFQVQSIQQATKPNFGVIYAGLGVLMTFVIAIGGLAYWPIKSSIEDLKVDARQSLNRDELNFRSEATNRRFQVLETAIERVQARRYDEMREELRALKGDFQGQRGK